MTQLLRDDLGFEGLVMTDDLDMGAIYNEYGLEETIRMAITAGNDLAMICHRIDAIGTARETLSRLPNTSSIARLANIARFKTRCRLRTSFRRTLSAPSTPRFGSCACRFSGEERAAERSAEDGKRSPVETY